MCKALIALLLLAACTAPAEPAVKATSQPSAAEPRTVASVEEDCGQQRVDHAVQELPVDTPAGWTVQAECGTDGNAGEAHLQDKRILVWPEILPDAELAFTLLHEYGHAFDFDHLTREDRELWRYARGISGSWSACHPFIDGGEEEEHGGCWDPSEDFAEAFAMCHTDIPTWRSFSQQPSRAECALLLALLDEAELDRRALVVD
jgi:hypothetical protein